MKKSILIVALIEFLLILLLFFGFFFEKKQYSSQVDKYQDLYTKSMEYLGNIMTQGRYPDAFYATIEEITNDFPLANVTEVKVKGLDVNELRYRKNFTIHLSESNIPVNLKIQHNGTDISINDLKVGQKIAVYDYSHNENTSDTLLQSVFKIVVLNDEL